MEQVKHFSHSHLLSLVHLQPNNKQEDSEEEDGDDIMVEDQHGGQCNLCKEQIYSFHLGYYHCNSCDYSLHKYCAQLPETIQNHPSHPGHNLTISMNVNHEWMCDVCFLHFELLTLSRYECYICGFNMDIICATISHQKMDHPSHPHQLVRASRPIVSSCHACGKEHKGTFYDCTTCSHFWIHLNCALLPTKLLIEKATSDIFTHSHPLTLSYSFPDLEAKFYPTCRVCDHSFSDRLWLYKCDKCRYYVHLDCVTSIREPFMSIFMPPGRGKTTKIFEDTDHPNLLHCPFPDESNYLVKHHFFTQNEFFKKENNDEYLNHPSHPHLLILLQTQKSLHDKSISLHNPMKRIQLLCDGCVKPIMTLPFYKCSQYVPQCEFVLHEWCAKLPPTVQDHPCHPEHMLVLLPKVPSKLFGVFDCSICKLPSNSFAYECTMCDYYIDINCAFIPEEIVHEAHPNHILSRVNVPPKVINTYCNACLFSVRKQRGFHCPCCDFFLHIECALLLPKIIMHRFDKHPLSLRYHPVENHISEYYCEICEDEFDPEKWFYHCTKCVQSMHASCVPLKLECKQAVYSKFRRCVFKFLNVKFGGMHKIEGHPHHLEFVQGMDYDGECTVCDDDLQFTIIVRCLTCKFAVHIECANVTTGKLRLTFTLDNTSLLVLSA